jgi:protein O-GlcNAcase/histone acetyltransferase
MIEKETDVEMHTFDAKFLCGVVEGFYGRPWTTVQRKKLFVRMKKMGMNTYLYAPKDDCKHRMYWRDQYSVEEAEHLTALINDATENDVIFVYALSPGLDMNYSNSKEVTYLKKKLEQVASFGCKAFALLFDDIDVDMCEADKEVFQSFAHAQVSVTNEVYQHLEQPRTFLFCPTEYCASRAVPTVIRSEYLNTLGSKLLPGIDIMWTGPKVISKDITVESIKEISSVLQRPPVIWDNIHANDYDQKRLFLGPYDGRSPELIPHLHGVLTNPNCEFEANYVAMHTLAQWSKSNMEAVKKDLMLSSSPVSSDIKLEREGENETSPFQTYQPKQALIVALKDWLLEFGDDCGAVKIKVAKAPPPIVPPPMMAGADPANPSIPLAVAASLGVANVNELTSANVNELNALDSFMQPETAAVVNSLVDASSSDSETESLDGRAEPMDCALSSNVSPPPSGENPTSEVDNVKQDIIDTEMDDVDSKTSVLSYDDISFIVDMFYMPFEHGSRGVELLNDFNWLKNHCYFVTEAKCKNATVEQRDLATDWETKCEKFHQEVHFFQTAINHLCESPNRAILYDLYPYIWDMKVSLDILSCFIRWLASVAIGHGLRFNHAFGATNTSASYAHHPPLLASG